MPADPRSSLRGEPAKPTSADLLPHDARTLIEQRWRAGRAERGLPLDAPFAWDRPELVGLDEAEELADAYTYRRLRYERWYGPRPDAWPFAARQRLADAERALDELIHELRCGPLDGCHDSRA